MRRKSDEIFEQLLQSKDYAALRRTLAGIEPGFLAEYWPKFPALRKLTLFKLMDALSAWEFYGTLPFKEKYLLLCGFPLNAIAPVLEQADAQQRRLFVQLPREFHDRMFRQLLSERSVLALTLSDN